MAPFPGVISQFNLINLSQLIKLGQLPSWKWQYFILPGIHAYSGYGPLILPCDASAKTIGHRLIRCLIHYHGIPPSIVFDQGTHLTANKVWQWAYVHVILILLCSPSSWSSWFDRVAERPIEYSVTALAGWQYIVALGQYYLGGYICCESSSCIWCCSPHNHIKRLKMKW